MRGCPSIETKGPLVSARKPFHMCLNAAFDLRANTLGGLTNHRIAWHVMSSSATVNNWLARSQDCSMMVLAAASTAVAGADGQVMTS